MQMFIISIFNINIRIIIFDDFWWRNKWPSPEFVSRSPRFKPRCRGLPATWDSAPLVLRIRLLLVDNFHIGLFRPGEKDRLLNFTTSFVDAVPRDAVKCQATPWLFLHIFILMHAFTACLNVRDEKVDFAYEKEEFY